MPSRECEICSNPARHQQASYCATCRRLVNRVDTRRDDGNGARKGALKNAWDGESFRCYYSDVPLVVDKSSHPLYLTFDHRTPRAKGDLVVAAAVINDMKTDMSEEEFRRLVLELARKFSGKTFDERVVRLKYWKRQ